METRRTTLDGSRSDRPRSYHRDAIRSHLETRSTTAPSLTLSSLDGDTRRELIPTFPTQRIISTRSGASSLVVLNFALSFSFSPLRPFVGLFDLTTRRRRPRRKFTRSFDATDAAITARPSASKRTNRAYCLRANESTVTCCAFNHRSYLFSCYISRTSGSLREPTDGDLLTAVRDILSAMPDPPRDY